MGSHWKLKPNICSCRARLSTETTVLSNHNLWQIKAHILSVTHFKSGLSLCLPHFLFFVINWNLRILDFDLFDTTSKSSICSSSIFSSLHQTFKFQSKSCFFLLQFRGLSDLRLWYSPRGNAFTCNISFFLQYFRVLRFQWNKHGGSFSLKHSYVYYLCILSYLCWEFDWISWF